MAVNLGPLAVTEDRIDLGVFRQLLRNAFTSDDLWRLCQDNPDFREVTHHCNAGSPLEDVIDAVVQYCQPRLLLSGFLAKVKDVRLAQYTRYAAKLYRKHPEFVNREWEISQVIRPDSPRFIMIDGPASFGKTYFLRKVSQEYDGRSYKCGFLVLDRTHDQKRLMSHVLAALDSGQTREDPQDVTQLAERIGTLSASVGKNRFLLAFDSFHYLDEALARWLLCTLLPELDALLTQAGLELRCLFAGRYIARQWLLIQQELSPAEWAAYDELESEYGEVNLTPFEYPVVKELVNYVAGNQGLNPPIKRVETLAREVLALSGGHPGVMRSLIDEVAARGFVVPPSFFADTNRPKLFAKFVSPVLREILGDVSLDVQNTIRLLSVLRGFNPDVLSALFRRFEGRADIWSQWPIGRRDGDALTIDLERYRLVSLPNQSCPLYSDRIVRRLLALDLEINAPGVFEELHQFAANLFQNWSSGLNEDGTAKLLRPFTGFLLLTFMVESVYHRLMLLEIQRRRNKTPATPESQGDFGGRLAIENLRREFRLMLFKDKEIGEAMRALFGETTVPQVWEEIDRVFRETPL
jgi:hypothetical protein